METKKFTIDDKYIDANGHLSEVGYYYYAVQTVWEINKDRGIGDRLGITLTVNGIISLEKIAQPIVMPNQTSIKKVKVPTLAVTPTDRPLSANQNDLRCRLISC